MTAPVRSYRGRPGPPEWVWELTDAIALVLVLAAIVLGGLLLAVTP